MKGLLLVNLGSPKDLEDRSIKEYLSEFLSDDLVVDYPKVIQQILVNWVIVPNRYKKTQRAYSKIWSDGSPLINNTKKLSIHLEEESCLPTEVAMRYQEPSIKEAIISLKNKGCTSIKAIPLYPHYAISSTLTTKNKVKDVADQIDRDLKIDFVEPFYNDPEYINSLCSLIRENESRNSDLLLFSYHGIPIRHLRKASPEKKHNESLCIKSECNTHEYCYRHQVYETSRLCAEKLNMPKDKWRVSFQSRIGPGWLKPFTDKELRKLPEIGIKKIDVISPSFVIDNLETLEEINIEGRKDFLDAGGEEFNYIPCLNYRKDWVKALNHLSKK